MKVLSKHHDYWERKLQVNEPETHEFLQVSSLELLKLIIHRIVQDLF
jgi:hypothetical protein